MNARKKPVVSRMDYQVEPELDSLIEFDGTSLVFPCSKRQFRELSLGGDWDVAFRDNNLFLTPTLSGHGNYQLPEYWVPFLLRFIKEANRLKIELDYQKIGFILRSRYDKSYGSLTIYMNMVTLYSFHEEVGRTFTLDDLKKEENWQPDGPFYLGPKCFI